jgi:hypothetical protein
MDAKPNDDPADATEEPTEGTPASTDSTGEDKHGEDDEFAHLDSLEDGAGCAEVWEHLSETRGDE